MNMMISLIALLFIASLCLAAKFTTAYLRSKNIKRINLLVNIHQKIFMTAWLGFFFASFFLILSYLSSRFFEKEFLLSLIAYGKENPGAFFYLGGVIFISVTLLVYFVRLMGKRFYSHRKKS